ncbi:cell division cycle 20.5, cofactor of APC complex isoform X4 [Cephus cinctus]|uniref:Cell division cycle 20.5, cofactor of APC complex isoform X4 n=1 Tax=Cephus cinctus TaxID=211228 RepID=A0AAJ7FKZ0_CEPCN|nr:cell division cycle 20.5, cofactor of APC complex isoform X4 [Cephus cinctus]
MLIGAPGVSRSATIVRYSPSKMYRAALDWQENEHRIGSVYNTPLRGSLVKSSKRRLLDKLFKAEESPIYTLKPTKGIPYRISNYTVCPYDRFISNRRHLNLEAANHLLTKEPIISRRKNMLDLFAQVGSIKSSWQKKLMKYTFEKTDVIGGLKQGRLLTLSKPSTSDGTVPGHLIGKPKEFWDDNHDDDCIWDSRSRKKPLLGTAEFILDDITFQPTIQKNLLDWSALNIIAGTDRYSITLFPITTNIVPVVRIKEEEYVSAVKFSRCGCTEGRLVVYSASSGKKILQRQIHRSEIYTVLFSMDFRFVASASRDTTVRISSWPHLLSIMEIGFYCSLRAIAWHPWENAKLAIGGGSGDTALTLWNVNTRRLLGYRRVVGWGCIDSLSWNKLSGELVVNWYFWETKSATVVVLASLDHVVDVVPVPDKTRIFYTITSPDGKQLGTQFNRNFSVWNFFGDEYYIRQKTHKFNENHSANIGTDVTKNFMYYNIR